VHFPGLVVDVRSLACLGWDVSAVSRFASAGFWRTVAMLKVPFGRMVPAVVLVARVAFALTKTVYVRVCGVRLYSYIGARLRRAVVRHGNLQIW
jgi:hypothetical protein